MRNYEMTIPFRRMIRFKPGRKKAKPAQDSVRFISTWIEEEFPTTWGRRDVVPGKIPKLEDLHDIDGFMDIMEYQGWSKLCKCDDYSPELVQLFFANLTTSRKKNQGLLLRSYVMGEEVFITTSDVNSMFDLDDGAPFMISCISKEEAPNLLKEACLALCGDEKLLLNKMNMCARAISFVVCQFIQGRGGKEFTDYDIILTYKAMQGVKIDFGDVMFYNIELASKSNRRLPYGGILTAMFEMLGVDMSTTDSFKIKQMFGKRNLSSIMGKRKMTQTAGDPLEAMDSSNAEKDEAEAQPIPVGGSSSGKQTQHPSLFEEIQQLHVENLEMRRTMASLMDNFDQFRQETTAKLNATFDVIAAQAHAEVAQPKQQTKEPGANE